MELLPRGGFIIATSDFGLLEGRFCTWSLKRFCDKCFNGSLQDMVKAMAAGLTIEQMAVLLLSGIEYMNRKAASPLTLSIDDGYEIIDDAGGFLAFAKLVNHAFNSEDDTKKKAEEKPEVKLVGQSY